MEMLIFSAPQGLVGMGGGAGTVLIHLGIPALGTEYVIS